MSLALSVWRKGCSVLLFVAGVFCGMLFSAFVVGLLYFLATTGASVRYGPFQ